MVIRGRNKKNKECLAQVLKNKGIVIMVCDTIYGILGVAPETEEKIRGIKGRSENMPFLQLLADKRQLKSLTEQDIPKPILNLWPGPVTLIVRNKNGGTTAYRVPSDPFLRSLVKKSGAPLYSTSVNETGMPAAWDIKDITERFETKVDLILDDGDIPGRQPSTILDISQNSVTVVRKGAYKIPQERLDRWSLLFGNKK